MICKHFTVKLLQCIIQYIILFFKNLKFQQFTVVFRTQFREFTDGDEVLTRKPLKDGRVISTRDIRNYFLPSVGIKVIGYIDEDFDRIPIHGMEGD